MKIRLKRNSIDIVPEGPVDIAYIEEVLGMKREGECAIAKRVDANSGYALLTGRETMYIEIKKVEVKE